MASNPGLFTEWPWKKLGNFKYVLLAPFVAHSVHSYMREGEGGDQRVDLLNLCIIPMQLLRVIHTQFWISFSRFQTARSSHRIVNKSLEFEQVDRERNWDDQIILTTLLFYISKMFVPSISSLPWWDTRGAVAAALLHAGPVEFLYYWFHRALHHHFLYSRYHSHHHASIVTEPITAVIHPFAEEAVYFLLFAIPLLSMVFTGTASIGVVFGYQIYIDLMNYIGHCNFELVPEWLFNIIPPLKYIMYTPSFHSLHHTQFRTNLSLFMPFYDYVYGTMDKSTDNLYESTLKGMEETVHVVHVTHPTTLLSIYHLRLGFAALSSKPYSSKWYMTMMWPMTWLSMLLTWTVGSAFTVERNALKKLKMQTWAIPRYSFQYSLSWEKEGINSLIGQAIQEAEEKGAEVVTLGLLNQGEELNKSGEIFVQKNPQLKVRIVDGSSLAAAVVLHSIPKGTTDVLLRGNPSKMASALALALCQKGIQVMMVNKAEFHAVKSSLPVNLESYLKLSNKYDAKVWLVGNGFKDKDEQKRATKGTRIIPFSQFPPRKMHKGCTYYTTPAMKVPSDFENMHSCENWLPRRVMSAWRIAGVVHALEGWEAHECGDTMLDIDVVWSAALRNGFTPLVPAE